MWYYLTHSWEDKGVHTFPKGICLKVNVIALLEYELADCDFTVHRFNHYTTRPTPEDRGKERESDREKKDNVRVIGRLFVWLVFLWHINLCSLFYAKSIFIQINNSI